MFARHLFVKETDEAALELERYGIGAGDRVAFLLPTSVRLLSLLLASIRIGAAICPLNPRLPPAQIQEQLLTLRPKILIDEKITHFSSSLTSPPTSFHLFTSGSTNKPKCAHLTLDNFISNALPLIDLLPLTSSHTWLLSLPLYHVGGLSILIRSLLSGAKISLESTSSITHLSYVPTQLYRATPIYPHLHTLLLGGAPITLLPPRLPIVATYGLTEMASAVLATRSPTWKNSHLYLGFPLPNRELKLIDNELHVKGPTLFHGYDTPIDRTRWFPTKDLALYDPLLGYAIVGRKDNQFISGGENIQPEEIERLLLQHPHILEALVIPKLDPEFGARPTAHIHSTHPITLEELRAFLSERLPKYKLPISLHPLSPSSLKPSRKQLFLALNKEK